MRSHAQTSHVRRYARHPVHTLTTARCRRATATAEGRTTPYLRQRKMANVMSDDKVFFCKLCERTWPELPAGAVRLTNNRGRGHAHVNTYRFADGSIHV